MTIQDPRPGARQFFEDMGVPHWLITGGFNSLLALLLGIGVAAILYVLKLGSSVSVPLIIAVIIATVAHPLVKLGDRIKLPRVVSSAIVVLIILGLGYAAIQITFTGVVSQAPAIGKQLSTGVIDLGNYTKGVLVNMGVDERIIDENIREIDKMIRKSLTPSSGGGVSSGKDGSSGDGTSGGSGGGNTSTNNAGAAANATPGASATNGADAASGILNLGSSLWQGASDVGRFLSGVAGGLFSVFIGLVFLFYFLSDYERIRDWLGGHLFRKKELGENVVRDTTRSLRGYFRSLTVTALIVEGTVGIVLWALGVPLVVPIVIVGFLTSYIPFFGAFLATGFTALIALSSGGLTMALITVVVRLLANNVLQTFIISKLMGDELNLHPIVVLLATLIGSVFAGILGAALGAPFVAIAIGIYQRIKEDKEGPDSEPPEESPLLPTPEEQQQEAESSEE